MEASFGQLLSQVARLLRRSFDERARGIGVTRPQWQVLSMLRVYPGIKQSGLADILEVEPITAGRMVDRLQDAGLVERRADPADRRAWRLHLTERGEELLERLRPLTLQTYDVALEGLSAADREDLMRKLEIVRANLTRRMGPDPAD